MMKLSVAALLLIIGFVGCEYFGHYKGEIIPLPGLWAFGSVLLMLAGLLLFFSFMPGNKDAELRNAEMPSLGNDVEVVAINIDNCEFKRNDYTTEVISQSFSRASMFNALTSKNKNFSSTPVSQSVVIYNHLNGTTGERFVSHAFPFDETTLN